jgi:hypothetical protein
MLTVGIHHAHVCTARAPDTGDDGRTQCALGDGADWSMHNYQSIAAKLALKVEQNLDSIVSIGVVDDDELEIGLTQHRANSAQKWTDRRGLMACRNDDADVRIVHCAVPDLTWNNRQHGGDAQVASKDRVMPMSKPCGATSFERQHPRTERLTWPLHRVPTFPITLSRGTR